MIELNVIGHLGKDALVNNVNGKIVINFSVAHTEKYKDGQGATVEKTTWVNCSYWSDRTAIAQYLNKGTQVYVKGTPSVDVYTIQDRQTIAQLRLRVSIIELLSSNNRQTQAQPEPVQQQAPATIGNDIADDLPF